MENLQRYLRGALNQLVVVRNLQKKRNRSEFDRRMLVYEKEVLLAGLKLLYAELIEYINLENLKNKGE